ncbi:MAG: hypothetical protein ACQEXE_17605 [Bacillota bacterium]|uniref:hypothetical protein n=1 Tax=Bacillaceae TaxID=186817 RepID=UPI0013D2E0D8|nr:MULTISPECIES: hypothetical protein [Bacillaceae]MBY6053172.1 hypothetical protein [Cytobacillus firmus]
MFEVNRMIQLNIIFVLFILTLLARYWVFDAFEPAIFAAAFLFPAASIMIFFISKRLADRERAYQPKSKDDWSFYHIQKSLMVEKPLFKGQNLRGYVKRYFPQRWQYVLGDSFGLHWYLSFEVLIDQDLYDVRWYRKKWISQQDQWRIYKNGIQIGEAHTVITLKNAAKLKEAIEYRLHDVSYISSASSVMSAITLTRETAVLGGLKRSHIISGVQEINVEDNNPDYLVALIIHSFYFKN